MKVIMACGGTGGHIYPAIAIADKIKRKNPDAEILFIGTQRGMESTLVPQNGYAFQHISASGFNRKNWLKNGRTLVDIIKGSRQARALMKTFHPDFVIGTGGYVTGPVLKEAHRLGITTYIQEQNAVPGVANKMLEKYASKVFVSFSDSAKFFKDQSKLVFSGNPIRKAFSLAALLDCRKKLGISEKDFMVLIFGGSLGAEVLNKEALKMIRAVETEGINIFFVTGSRYFEDVSATLLSMENAQFVTLIPYADNMPELLTAADLVISRAGAIALSEITACGKPSILVPSPNVTNNHQYYNAKALEMVGAAVLLQEADFSEEQSLLADFVLKLKSNREKLNAMAKASSEAGRIDAVDIIYDHLNIV
ncbi:MAG: undecaprenyldiphospho-muramoylpentapeptide beta-N-acetylglucosaminyltransferase [Clostridia bacterium]|nr:undecaprenyldiphospho-muramoylpentapeptide beta-N-acetylglucosaminyltransferase [Clostridia bacterium]